MNGYKMENELHKNGLLNALRRYGDKPTISTIEKRKIVQYLENPVSCGLWHLVAPWVSSAGISADIWAQIEKEINGKEILVIRSGKRDRRVKVSEEWLNTLRNDVCSRLTFIFTLFDSIMEQETQQSEDKDQYGVDHESTQLVLDIIDIGPIKEKYAAAFTYFRDHIWDANFNPTTHLKRPSRVKNGIFIIQKGPGNGGVFAAISWEKAPLHDLSEFLGLVGKIEDAILMPVFSPEEEVFAPYFDLLGMAYDLIVPQEHLQPLIHKAITNFGESNFTDCVSAIGLAAEDVLTQIYETLYREQLTKGLTLGQLADELHAKAAAKFKKKDEAAPDVASLYPELKAAIEDSELSPSRSVELLRKVLTVTVDFNKYIVNRVDKVGKQERRISIWTDDVNHSVTELIRYRNAASHKTRIPIGPMECRRAAYSFVVLIRWWFRERMLIDWSKSADDIIRGCAERNSKTIH